MAGFPRNVTFDVEVADVLGHDDIVSALVHVTAKSGDDSLSYDIAEWARYEDGKMIERRVYSNDTARIMEFFEQIT